MKAITTAVLTLAALSLAAPAFAEYSTGANPNIPVTQRTPESEELPLPSASADELQATGSNSTEYVSPSKDVKPYVEIDQAGLPYDPARAAVDGSITYVPGIEILRGGKATKEITDQVPE